MQHFLVPHFPANIIFLYGWSKFHVCMHHIFIIYSSVDRHLRQFHFPANRVAMKKDVQVFLWWDTESFRYMCRNDIAGSYCSSICSFWEASTLVSSTTTPVYITTNTEQGPSFPVSFARVCFHVSLRTAILKTAVKWSLKVVLICTFLMANYIKTFKDICGPFESLLWRTVCLVHWPCYWLAQLIN